MIASQKQELRAHMKDKRALSFQNHPDAGTAIARLFFEAFTFPPQTVIGGYWPIERELDTRPLLQALVKKGFICALPCISSQTLVFRLWEPACTLVKRGDKTFAPPSSFPCITPSALLIPLLAFDRKGHGRGHYDHYLDQQESLKIGVGFHEQEVDHVPVEAHDKCLDYILTERTVITCG